ncbi:MAG: hypothetical protein ACKPKO_58990, partial [Candidatus Fonsibacter sp.]
LVVVVAAVVVVVVASAAEQVVVATVAPLGHGASIELAHAHSCWSIVALALSVVVATMTETGQQSWYIHPAQAGSIQSGSAT